MKVADTDIIIVPGYENSGETHWQTRWEQKLSTARRVEQAQWSKPERDEWVAKVVETVNAATKPVVLIAHSLGIPTTIHAVPKFKVPVAGAFLVAPPDVSNPKIRPKHLMTFGPYPREPLGFPSVVIASRNELLNAAKGELVAWMDSDDISIPERLALQVVESAQFDEW